MYADCKGRDCVEVKGVDMLRRIFWMSAVFVFFVAESESVLVQSRLVGRLRRRHCLSGLLLLVRR